MDRLVKGASLMGATQGRIIARRKSCSPHQLVTTGHQFVNCEAHHAVDRPGPLPPPAEAKEHAMTRLEQIARDLAAVLSPQGEEDWRRFLPLAEKVGGRLDRQFVELVIPEAESAPSPGGSDDFTRRRKPPSSRRI